jgi:hypothetical protein
VLEKEFLNEIPKNDSYIYNIFPPLPNHLLFHILSYASSVKSLYCFCRIFPNSFNVIKEQITHLSAFFKKGHQRIIFNSFNPSFTTLSSSSSSSPSLLSSPSSLSSSFSSFPSSSLSYYSKLSSNKSLFYSFVSPSLYTSSPNEIVTNFNKWWERSLPRENSAVDKHYPSYPRLHQKKLRVLRNHGIEWICVDKSHDLNHSTNNNKEINTFTNHPFLALLILFPCIPHLHSLLIPWSGVLIPKNILEKFKNSNETRDNRLNKEELENTIVKKVQKTDLVESQQQGLNQNKMVNVAPTFFHYLPLNTRELIFCCDCCCRLMGSPNRPLACPYCHTTQPQNEGLKDTVWNDIIGDSDDGSCDWSSFLTFGGDEVYNRKAGTDHVSAVGSCISRDDFEQLIAAVPLNVHGHPRNNGKLSDLERQSDENIGRGLISSPTFHMRSHLPFITTVHMALCPGLCIDDTLVGLFASQLKLVLRSLLLQVYLY